MRFNTDLFPVFRPRRPWLSADLQTLRNFLCRPRFDLSPWPETRLDLPMNDDSGDRLVGHLHQRSESAGLVLLLHGLSGCADSFYVRATAHHLLMSGYAVLRLNLRGAGPSRQTCCFDYHAGRTDDLRAVLAQLPRQPLAAVGYSLGANMLLKYLGEEGSAARLMAAVSVSAPIDLRAASRRMMDGRNWLYQRHLVDQMRADALRAPGLPAEMRQTVTRVRTIYEYDERVVALRNGFAGAEDYYARCSANGYLSGIAVPTLVIQALDDPWIPADAYRQVVWERLPKVTALLPSAGGHVGFHGAGSRIAWHDRCSATFFAHALR